MRFNLGPLGIGQGAVDVPVQLLFGHRFHDHFTCRNPCRSGVSSSSTLVGPLPAAVVTGHDRPVSGRLGVGGGGQLVAQGPLQTLLPLPATSLSKL
jgi:hypothetical protein